MTLALGTIPVQAWNGRGSIEQRTFPHKTPQDDPGAGGGGSDTITVYKDGSYRLCWRNSGTPATIPPGYSANPTLTGSEQWWPHGIHTFGRVTHSPNFGVIISKVVGLRLDGVIGHCHAAFWHHLDDRNTNQQGYSYRGGTWKQVGKTNYTGSALTPPEGGANSFHQHFGYDYGRNTDLAHGTAAQLDLYYLSGKWDITGQFVLGSLLWQGTANHRDTLGFQLVDSTMGVSGFDRICLGWLGQWWVLQFGQGTNDVQKIWGFNPSQSGQSSAWTIPIQSDVASRMQAAGHPGNLCMCVDQVNQRVIAAQADVLGSPILEGGRTKWPLRLFLVNPSTFVFTPISMATTMYIVPPFKDSPLVWQGGNTFIYFDQRAPNGQGDYYWGASLEAGTYADWYSGGYVMKEIFIPTGTETRTVAWTQNATTNWGALSGSSELHRQKHIECAFRPQAGLTSDGRVWWHGGDLSGGTFESYSQAVISFDPGNISSSLVVEQPASMTGQAVRPWKPDENGFQYRASSDDFWMMYGYSDPTSSGKQGTWVDFAQWTSVTGGDDLIWRMNATTKVWTVHTPTPAPGFSTVTWPTISTQRLRWYYDSVADAMIVWAFGGWPEVQRNGILVLDCATMTYKAYRCDQIDTGNTTLPDGRYVTQDNTGPCREDRAALDSTNGALYVYSVISGDLFRIMTRATPTGTNPSYLPLTWCCKLPPTNQTKNSVHLQVRNGVVWVFRADQTGRCRLFSWAIGEGAAQEHLVPIEVCASAVFKYTSGGDTRFGVFGGPYNYKQFNTTRAAAEDKIYTLTITP